MKSGKYIRLARERNRQLHKEAKGGHPKGYYFDEQAADRVCGFFTDYLCHWQGEWAGQPLDLEKWQREQIVRPLFGWKRPDGSRLYRVAYVEIPRKNGKSTLAAGVGLYLTVGDGEAGAEVYSSATKKDQAKIVFRSAKQMLKKSPKLLKHADYHQTNIHCERLASRFEPLGADADTLDGLNAHGNIVDELHAHRDREVWDVLITSQGSRRSPMTFCITTAGLYDPESIGWEQHDWATKVLEGDVEDDAYFAYVASADPEDDWADPKVWEAANPNFGVSVKESYLADLCNRAKNSLQFQNTYLRKHLDIWTQQVTKWLPMDKWAEAEEDINWDDFRNVRCYAGLDLSSTTDLTALVLIFVPDNGELYLYPKFWIPEDTAREVSQKRIAPYLEWVEQGHLIATPGNVIDYDFIRSEVHELADRFRGLVEIGYDPYNATQITVQLENDGFQCAKVRQGFITLNEPSKFFEKRLLEGMLKHDGNPVLRWNASNAAVDEDAAGNIKPVKTSRNAKIDGITAAATGLDGLVRGREEVSGLHMEFV